MINLEKRALIGEVSTRLYGEDGLLKAFRKAKNITVTKGFQLVCHLMGNPAYRPGAFRYSAIGDGVDPPVLGDTKLVSELARAEGGYTGPIGDTVWKNDCTFGAGVGTGTIREAGLFNETGANAETMLCRQTFGAITKTASDTLVVTWQYTLSG